MVAMSWSCRVYSLRNMSRLQAKLELHRHRLEILYWVEGPVEQGNAPADNDAKRPFLLCPLVPGFLEPRLLTLDRPRRWLSCRPK